MDEGYLPDKGTSGWTDAPCGARLTTLAVEVTEGAIILRLVAAPGGGRGLLMVVLHLGM